MLWNGRLGTRKSASRRGRRLLNIRIKFNINEELLALHQRFSPPLKELDLGKTLLVLIIRLQMVSIGQSDFVLDSMHGGPFNTNGDGERTRSVVRKIKYPSTPLKISFRIQQS